ncbi:MAG: hypothetical protein ACRDIU_06765 [Actinomycetota bacterium]
MNSLLFLVTVTLGFIAVAAGLIQHDAPASPRRKAARGGRKIGPRGAAHRRPSRWINREATSRAQALFRLLAMAAILGFGAAIAVAAAAALLIWMAEKLAS